MRRNNIYEVAEKAAMENRSAKENLFMELMRHVTSDSYSSELNDWVYNATEHYFQKSFSLWMGGYQLRDSEYEQEKGEIHLKLQYEDYEQRMYGIVRIPEKPQDKNEIAYRIAQRLRAKRESFLKDWKENARKVMEEYFEEHKEEFLKYPICFMSSGFKTKSFVIWSCNTGNEDTEMREKLGILTNQVDETLNRKSYFPCFWKSEESLTADVRLGGYILHIERVETPDKSFLHNWPDVKVSFEIISSQKSEWENGLEIIQLRREKEQAMKYKDFVEALYNAEWQFRKNDTGKREIFAHIPVIFDQYAEYICKKARKEFLGEIQVIGTSKRRVPRYDNDEMTCIEVVALD